MASTKSIIEKYPSLRKLETEGPDYVEFGDGREARVLDYIRQHPTFAELRGSPSRILAVMDEFAAQEDFLISVGPDKQRILGGIVAEEKPSVLVELGGYLGYSAILFADAMGASGGGDSPPEPPAPIVWSLEASREFADIAAEIVGLAGLSHAVEIVVGPAEESLRRLESEGAWEGAGVDVLFLDHVEELYEHDLKVCEELGLLKPGALVLADNAVRPGAPEYVRYVRGNPGMESHGVKSLIIPGEFEDEIEVTRVIGHDS